MMPETRTLMACMLAGMLAGALAAGGLAGHYYHGLLSVQEMRLTEAEQQIAQGGVRAERLDAALGQALAFIEHSDESVTSAREKVVKLNKALEEEREAAEVRSGRKLAGHILGVSGDEGVAVPVEYELRQGEGRVLVNLEGAIFLRDAQDSIKRAHETAKAASGARSEGMDMIITILNPSGEPITLDGPSAGATMTVGMVAAMAGKEVRKDVFLTGAIGKGGKISPVGGIALKTNAARSANATVLLVPKGQKVAAEGLEVVEVSTLAEALEAMLEEGE